MATSWTIAIDWDRDGDYSGSEDDVTGRVIEANWFLGFREPYQDVADNAALTLVLDNSDRRFSPEYSGSPLNGKLLPFRPVRIQSDDGTTVRTHWVGWVESIQPAVNQYGQRVTQMVATGAMQFLKAAETALALQENKRTDEIVDALIQEVVFPPALVGSWVLGREGNSELGQTTTLANTSAYSELETGALTLTYAGDNWVRRGGFADVSKDTFDVYRAIRDVVAAERGRFFFDREGKAVFWNRHHLLDGESVDATFDDAMTGMAYTFASIEQTKNEVIVTCHPRKLSATSDVVLWELDDAVIRVPPNDTRELFVKYKDSDGNRIGGRNVTVTGLAFLQGNASATVDARANGAQLTFTNSGDREAIVEACRVEGQKLTDFGVMEAEARDVGSIVDYGRRTLKKNLPSIDDLRQAQYIADFEVDRRATPRGEVASVKLASHGQLGGGQHAQQLARTLGDQIRVQETQSAHDDKYDIVGEAHKLTQGGALYQTTWYLEPAPESYPWKLGASGRSELGQATTLTY